MPQTTIIELGGRRYKVTYLPDPEPIETINPLQTYELISPIMATIVGCKSNIKWNKKEVEEWIKKFPKSLNNK